MFLVASFDTFVEKRIQNDQERHVDDQHRYNPYYNDNNDLNDAGVAIFVLANASRTKFLFVADDLLINFWQNHSIAIAEKSLFVTIVYT